MATVLISLNPRRRGGLVSVFPDGHPFNARQSLNPPARRRSIREVRQMHARLVAIRDSVGLTIAQQAVLDREQDIIDRYDRGELIDGGRSSLPGHGFAKLHFPGVEVAKLKRFIGKVGPQNIRHRWRVIIDELPNGRRRKFVENEGELTIDSGPAADYSWSQFRGFIEDRLDNSRVSEDL